ncbi:MAG TPA: NAD(P)/FAD-dependent oxidoreductase, partial [Polyangiales bacterium]|nr:NAD(P)/FAD-dependent oxidoreductase [Polyangiales bacterium]
MTNQNSNIGFVEQGSMWERLATVDARPEHFDVVVIGGGQAGLSAGYYLKQRGARFVILDANARIGDVWRNRWDSLRLFTACRWDGLPGFPFPESQKYAFPTKNEMADYLEAYAEHFKLPVRTSSRVELVTRRDGYYVVQAAGREYLADNVIVAMSHGHGRASPHGLQCAPHPARRRGSSTTTSRARSASRRRRGRVGS